MRADQLLRDVLSHPDRPTRDVPVHARARTRLLVSSFLLMDPMLAMRTGSVPYWALFGTQPPLDRLAGYLSRSQRPQPGQAVAVVVTLAGDLRTALRVSRFTACDARRWTGERGWPCRGK
jgi:hypothetical protein